MRLTESHLGWWCRRAGIRTVAVGPYVRIVPQDCFLEGWLGAGRLESPGVTEAKHVGAWVLHTSLDWGRPVRTITRAVATGRWCGVW